MNKKDELNQQLKKLKLQKRQLLLAGKETKEIDEQICEVEEKIKILQSIKA